jgi:hypothetical protein
MLIQAGILFVSVSGKHGELEETLMFVGWQLLQEEILLKECQIGVTSNACQPRLDILVV